MRLYQITRPGRRTVIRTTKPRMEPGWAMAEVHLSDKAAREIARRVATGDERLNRARLVSGARVILRGRGPAVLQPAPGADHLAHGVGVGQAVGPGLRQKRLLQRVLDAALDADLCQLSPPSRRARSCSSRSRPGCSARSISS
jgi:hypothetical protein